MGLPNKPQGLEKKTSLASNSSSYSFLELPWSQNEAHVLENARYLDRYRSSIEKKIGTENNSIECNKVARTEGSAHASHEKVLSHIDPMFYPYDIMIPFSMKRFVDNPPFRFSFVAQPCLEIKEKGVVKARFDVLDFKTVDKNIYVETKAAFVINRKRVRQLFVAEENRNYKNAVNLRTDYERGKNKFREMSDAVFTYQVMHKVNFIDISTREDFKREIKCIVKSFSEKGGYVPKVKTFDSGPDMFVRYVLSMIPGISKNVAGAIAARFGSIAAFLEFLESSTLNELQNIEVYSNDKSQKRPLGEKQSCLVKKFLLDDVYPAE